MKTASLNKTLFFSKTNDYLNIYLPKQAAKSDKTIKTYTDALTVFRRNLYSERGISIRSFKFEDCVYSDEIGQALYFRPDNGRMISGQMNIPF